MKQWIMFLAVAGLFLSSGQVFAQNNKADQAKLIIQFTDFEKNPLVGKTLVVVNQNSGKEYKGETDKNGKIVIHVPKGNSYQVVYKSVTGPEKYQAFKIPDKPGRITYTFNPQFERRESQVYTLKNVYFDTDKATLRESSYPALNNLLAAMEANEEMKIQISGHTDSRGDADYNRKLSQRRAESVKQYLVNKGIDPGRVKAKGYGESKPIATNETAEGRQKNRRTEVKILQE